MSSERSEVFQAVCIGNLLDKLGVERYSVMGTSYGGFVAYNMAKLWPERVEKVVIASSAVNKRLSDNGPLLERSKNTEVKEIKDLMLPKTAKNLRSLIELAVYKRPYVLPDFLLNGFLRNLYSDNIDQKKELLDGLILGRDNTVDVSPLQQEVLIVWGEHDKIFLLEKAVELEEYDENSDHNFAMYII
ncbi:hypothetical protein GIB67_025958 [Kingdonia uniflora]|uniref:AB hydrolase-1 domain-containing protein n=1 Tax=Kingdonia uniflora TaxID=39325 RepID=A0A7J7L824_9MAGN|nr:hypothetical protein GIB67_025958 [Kingdonia uniflora]